MSKQKFVKHVGDGDFEKTVLKNDKLILVDFWSCGADRAALYARFWKNWLMILATE